MDKRVPIHRYVRTYDNRTGEPNGHKLALIDTVPYGHLYGAASYKLIFDEIVELDEALSE